MSRFCSFSVGDDLLAKQNKEPRQVKICLKMCGRCARHLKIYQLSCGRVQNESRLSPNKICKFVYNRRGLSVVIVVFKSDEGPLFSFYNVPCWGFVDNALPNYSNKTWVCTHIQHHPEICHWRHSPGCHRSRESEWACPETVPMTGTGQCQTAGMVGVASEEKWGNPTRPRWFSIKNLKKRNKTRQ